MISLKQIETELTLLLGKGVSFGCLTRDLTSFRIGGQALALARVSDVSELKRIVSFLQDGSVPFFVLGAGTNLLFPDRGYKGILIRLQKDFDKIKIDQEGLIQVGAGAKMPRLAFSTMKRGYAGLEHLAVIPGTVGGGIVQNAGSGGQELATYLQEILAFNTRTAEVEKMSRADLEMSYRRSLFKQRKDLIVLEASFQLHRGKPAEMIHQVKEKIATRKRNLPISLPNAGSIFKRPGSGESPGKLIQEAGCKGLSVGGAMVSEKHANFIVNMGSATCYDVLKLMEIVRERVFTVSQIVLEPEIEIV